MNPSRIFILRPVATSLLMAAILLVGIFAYRFLPLSALPEVDYPTIQVQTFYPGASPDVMTSSVTAPLERQLGQMPGLKQMSSTSSAGASVITLQFSLDLSLDVAEQEVQAAINAAGNLLPSDLPAPPIYAKVNPADAPVLTLALTSKTLPLTQVEDLADTRLAQKISQLPGVGLVSIGGGQRPAVRIQANCAAARRLRPQHRRPAHDGRQRQRQHAEGQFRRAVAGLHDQRQRPAQEGQRTTRSWSSPTGTARRSGSPTWRRPWRRAENTKLAAWIEHDAGGHPQHPAPARRQRHRGRRRHQGAAAAAPGRRCRPAIDVTVLTDRTTTIRASVADVEFELGLAVVLVVLVIFLFLRSPSATIIPSLSVPLSLVGTFAVMYLPGSA